MHQPERSHVTSGGDADLEVIGYRSFSAVATDEV